MMIGESVGGGADAAWPLLLPLPTLLEDGAVAEALSLVLPAGPGADMPGALLEAPGLDADGAGAESVVGEAGGTTGLLPGVVPGEDGGTGTSLCMNICTAFYQTQCSNNVRGVHWRVLSKEGVR